MRGPNFSVHEFKCPDCRLSCQLIQDGRKASMRHQLPKCKTYEATKGDGQKFLELAFIAVPPDKPDPILVAFRDSGEPVEAEASEPSTEHAEALAEAVPHVSEPTPEHAAALAEAAPKSYEARCTCLSVRGEHAKNCPRSPLFMKPEGFVPPAPVRNWPELEEPKPPAVLLRWQSVLDHLCLELNTHINERRDVSERLAKALTEAKPGDSLVGFDDTRIAAVAQAIVAICSGSKGHP